MGEIPDSHPRKASLLARAKLTQAAREGLLAESAMIAHGRGEAFDYLLGEKTSDSAKTAIKECAARLLAAENPIVSMNGNTTVLAGKQAIRAAAIIGCPIEVNIYYRTPERMEKLIAALESMKEEVAAEVDEKTKASVMAVEILGADTDGKIDGLEGPRSICSRKGIESADVVLVPLEDGDRCEALVALGKQVLVIDLNPLSRTARTATVTIVDEVARALGEMEELLLQNPQSTDWDNQKTLREALEIISDSSKRI